MYLPKAQPSAQNLDKPLQTNYIMAEEQQKSADGKPVASSNDGTERGYNEKNPTQPQGAFEPDGADEEPKPKNRDEVRKS